jgi:hypothetical protein
VNLVGGVLAESYLLECLLLLSRGSGMTRQTRASVGIRQVNLSARSKELILEKLRRCDVKGAILAIGCPLSVVCSCLLLSR